MTTVNLIRLKKAYHFALQDHEMAVADFMKTPSPQNTLRMSKAYERAAALRLKLQAEDGVKSQACAVMRLGSIGLGR